MFACQRQISVAVLLTMAAVTSAFTPSPLFQTPITTTTKTTSLFAVQSKTADGYTPKWVKQKSLAEELGGTEDLGFANVGLKGTISVVFKQGNETRTSMAWAGQPIRDVASQAGQFIKYGCGKGECGTCECLVNGKWIRPCISTVPATAQGEDFVISIKATKATKTSSGQFFSIKSFFMGFWNNLLGMIGFVKFRRAAKKNYDERREYEDLIKQKAMEKKLKRATEGV
jgi:ferredoxin